MKKLILLLFLWACVKVSAQTRNSTPISMKGASNQTISGLKISSATDHGISLSYCNNIIIENCIIENTGRNGISLDNCTGITIRNCTITETQTGVYAQDCQGLVVSNNKFLNMNGPMPRGQFVQFNRVNGAGNKISCNYGENILGQSNPEDAISIHDSYGTSSSPILVENNYIKGGGPSNSGGGIMLGDGGGSYQRATGNVVINPGQYGMAISSGTNCEISNNKVYGKQQPFTNVGIYIANYVSGAACSNNIITNNHVWWQNSSGMGNSFYNGGTCGGTNISGNTWQSSSVSENMAAPSCAGLTSAPPPASNQSPTVQSGSSQTITLPTNTVTLKGTASDPDGTIASWKWTKVSGPAGETIKSPNTAATDITGLTQGTYTFRLTVTDTGGASASDDLTVTVNAAAANQPPIVQSGASQTITLPTNKVTLNGSASDPDGSITTWKWTIESGPGGGTITSPNTAGTDVTGLIAGTYKMVLTVTDNSGAQAADVLYITVNAAAAPPPNQPPTAQSGASQSITLPTNTVTLKGTGTDPDGTISTWSWDKVSGPVGETIKSPNTATTDISGLGQGTYTFRLTVTDDDGAAASDNLTVTVSAAPAVTNKAPVAQSGANQSITLPNNTVTLRGAGTDADGSITTYSWTKVSGPAGETIKNANAATTDITGMVQGTYTFRLTVTDDKGDKGVDDMQVVVNAAAAPAPNKTPTSIAGGDVAITLPTNSVTLIGTGTDPDGTIVGYLWTKVSGPAGEKIETPNSGTTLISTLGQGAYVFRLTVTDNSGAKVSDDVQVTVNAAPAPPANKAPTVNAGADITIKLPVNYTKLTGTAADADGSIASYSWTKVSGPAGEVIETPGTISTMASSLVQGTYVFRLTVTDNSGAKATDDVQVVVNAAAPNQAPTVNAGADITIKLPVNYAKLTGTAADADGSIASYSWTKVSGPAGVIETPGTISTMASSLVQGTYQFRLTVTDNSGAKATDDVQVVVNAATPNQAPTVNAGANITITLPVNYAKLTGTAADADGSIASYAWTKVSGPAGEVIETPGAISTMASSLVQGTYQFSLTVTDDKGVKATDDVQVIVNAATAPTAPTAPAPPAPTPNQAPLANAGADITIEMPVNKSTLNGSSSSDADGTIASWSWTFVKGPRTPSIANGNTATVDISGMDTKGVYEFELTITDDKGATAKDRVLITVVRINKKPVAQTKQATTVYLPVQSAELDASDSYDPDGNIATYNWTYVSGPQAPRVLSPDKAKSVVTDLIPGDYNFEVTVTDNEGEVTKATMLVSVKNSTTRRLIPEVKLYPNPATSNIVLNIETQAVGRTIVTIFDIKGHVALTEEFVKPDPSFNKSINISKLPKGNYLVVINVDVQEPVVKKLIKF